MKAETKILVVEDNPADALLVQESFKKYGQNEFTLVHEPSLKNALARLSREDMDFVLLDIFLPDAFGLESLEKIKALNAEVPVIILTGHYDDQMAVHGLQIGAQSYLSKDRLEEGALVRAIKIFAEFKRHGF